MANDKKGWKFPGGKKAKRIGQMLLVALVSAVLLVVIFRSVDLEGFVRSARQIRAPYLLLSLAALYLSMLFMALKFAALYYSAPKGLVIRAAMAGCCSYPVPAGGFLGLAVTTAMLADVDDVYVAGSASIYDSVLKFSVMVFVGIVGAFFSSISLPWWYWALFLLLGLVVGCAVAFSGSSRGRNRLRALGERFAAFPWGAYVGRICDDLAAFSKGMVKHPSQMLKHYAYGCAGELLTALPFAVLAPTLGIEAALMDWIWINALARLVSGLPISAGGLGARESVLILALGWLAVDSSAALTLSLLYSVLNLLANALGALFFIGYPKSPKELFADAWESTSEGE